MTAGQKILLAIQIICMVLSAGYTISLVLEAKIDTGEGWYSSLKGHSWPIDKPMAALALTIALICLVAVWAVLWPMPILLYYKNEVAERRQRKGKNSIDYLLHYLPMRSNSFKVR